MIEEMKKIKVLLFIKEGRGVEQLINFLKNVYDLQVFYIKHKLSNVDLTKLNIYSADVVVLRDSFELFSNSKTNWLKNKEKILQICPKSNFIVFGNPSAASKFNGIDEFFHPTVREIEIHTREKEINMMTDEFGIVDFELLQDQIEFIMNLKKSDKGKLSSEKKKFYDSVVDIFKKRSTQTADEKKELIFISNKLKELKCESVLDAGCGIGRLSINLALEGYFVYGVDLSGKLIKEAKLEKIRICHEYKKTLNTLFFSQANLLNLSHLKMKFQAVICMWHTICDLKEYRIDLFKNLCSKLVSRGVIIFDFPDIEKNSHIQNNGIYENDTPFGKYISTVPDLQEIFIILYSSGFRHIEYYRVNWGIPKYVIVARTF